MASRQRKNSSKSLIDIATQQIEKNGREEHEELTQKAWELQSMAVVNSMRQRAALPDVEDANLLSQSRPRNEWNKAVLFKSHSINLLI